MPRHKNTNLPSSCIFRCISAMCSSSGGFRVSPLKDIMSLSARSLTALACPVSLTGTVLPSNLSTPTWGSVWKWSHEWKTGPLISFTVTTLTLITFHSKSCVYCMWWIENITVGLCLYYFIIQFQYETFYHHIILRKKIPGILLYCKILCS